MNDYFDRQADIALHDPERQAADFEHYLEAGIREEPARFIDVSRDAESGVLISVVDEQRQQIAVRTAMGFQWT